MRGTGRAWWWWCSWLAHGSAAGGNGAGRTQGASGGGVWCLVMVVSGEWWCWWCWWTTHVAAGCALDVMVSDAAAHSAHVWLYAWPAAGGSSSGKWAATQRRCMLWGLAPASTCDVATPVSLARAPCISEVGAQPHRWSVCVVYYCAAVHCDDGGGTDWQQSVCKWTDGGHA